MSKAEVCDLCGDQGPLLRRCRVHLTAPLQAELDGDVLVLRCYVPECRRVVARFNVIRTGETVKDNEPADKSPTWAIVDLMGHLRLAGRLTEEEKFGSKVGRIDVPQKDGTFTTQYFGGGSVYRICVVSEAVARAAADFSAAPLSPWDFPKQLGYGQGRGVGAAPGGEPEDYPEPDDEVKF